MKYIIGIDIGTTATKTILFDENLVVIATASYDYEISSPSPLWAEQDPNDWWNATKLGIIDVLNKAEISNQDVVGIGLSGQMHGLVLLGDNGVVLMPSIIWCDQRTQAECQEITKVVGKSKLIEITANPAMTGFTASKIMWVKKHKPEIYRQTKHILLPKDYVRYKLTGVFATDVSDAGGMQLLDIKGRCWSDYILEKLDIDKSLLAKVYESQEITGYLSNEIAKELGLTTSCPVVGGAGDQAAAAIGCGVVSSGDISLTIGSSGVIFAATDKPLIDPQGRVNTLCHAVKNKWHIMSVTQSAGLALKWLKDDILQMETYKQMDGLASRVPVGSNELLFLPYLMGERSPIIDCNAKGCFYGLTYTHKKGEIIRSVLEGVALSQKHCLSVIEDMGVAPKNIKINGGGGASKLWRQIIADCLNRDLLLLDNNEGGAGGVAILTAVAAKIYPSVEAATAKLIREKEKILFQNNSKYDIMYNKYLKLYESTNEI